MTVPSKGRFISTKGKFPATGQIAELLELLSKDAAFKMADGDKVVEIPLRHHDRFVLYCGAHSKRTLYKATPKGLIELAVSTTHGPQPCVAALNLIKPFERASLKSFVWEEFAEPGTETKMGFQMKSKPSAEGLEVTDKPKEDVMAVIESTVKSHGVTDIAASEEVPQVHVPTREWIPQLNQFVQIEGEAELYILVDFDLYLNQFIVQIADSARAERAGRFGGFDGKCSRTVYESAGKMVDGSRLRPFTLRY